MSECSSHCLHNLASCASEFVNCKKAQNCAGGEKLWKCTSNSWRDRSADNKSKSNEFLYIIMKTELKGNELLLEVLCLPILYTLTICSNRRFLYVVDTIRSVDTHHTHTRAPQQKLWFLQVICGSYKLFLAICMQQSVHYYLFCIHQNVPINFGMFPIIGNKSSLFIR